MLWAILLGVLIVDAAWLGAGGWSFSASSSLAPVAAFALLVAPLGLARYRHDSRLTRTLQACAYLVAFTAASSVLSYLVVSTNAGLVDEWLAAADRSIGFDWPAVHRWMLVHPTVHAVLQSAYVSALPQFACVVLVLGFTTRSAQLDEFIELFAAGTLLVILISWLLPAAGPWTHYALAGTVDTSAMSHFAPLRDGSLRAIDLGQMQGLVSIPSLHTAMAIFFAYAMRGTRLLPVFAMLNVLMVVATPVEGGHYFVDVPAGAAMALLLIAARRSTA